ncbi:ATP-binding protein [Endothiovibrio diazotrophicus]
MKLRLTLFLFTLITLAAALTGLGVGIDGRRALSEVMEREIAATQRLTAQKVRAFDLFLSGLEGELDRKLREALVEIAGQIGKRDPKGLSRSELRALIAPYNLSDIYLINRRKVIDNTTFEADLGLDLGGLSAELDGQLEALYGSGRVIVDRISMSSRTGIIKKYAYYGPKGSDRIVEVSVNVREGFALIHSRAAQDFLFGVFFKSASEVGDRVVEEDLYIADEKAQWSLLRERSPLATGVAERLRAAGGRLELPEGEQLTIYQLHPIEDSHSGFHYISKTVYDVSLPDRFAQRSFERTLLILVLVVALTSLLASLLFRRWFTAPLDVILRGLRRIEGGDYRMPIELRGGDELARTAAVINAMQQGILSRENQLKEAHSDLERRVEERTAELQNSLHELEQREAAYRRAKQEAEAASRAKSEFLATMSHEIRTPMNAIIGMADILGDEEMNEQRRGYMEVLRRNSEALLTLINDILDLSKVEAGHFELEELDFELEPLVDEVVEAYRHLVEGKGVALRRRWLGEPGGVRHGDVARLRQVLTNLLGNAIKFTREGAIEVIVEVPSVVGEPVRFTVADSGIGIPAAKLESIFEPFTQADGSTTRRFGGTGLGLAICRRLVELMGGTIGVESREGEGSRFHFEVPLAVGHGALPEEEEARLPAD